MTGALTNAPPGATQQQHRHQLVYRDTAIVAAENITPDPHLTKVCKTASSKNKKQRATGCESIHIDVDNGQPTIKHTAGVHRELRDQFIAARTGKPPLSTKAFVHKVQEIEYHNVVSSGICADEFRNKHPREWTTMA